MTKEIHTEVRTRSLFGRIFMFLFIAFNLFMAYVLISYWSQLSTIATNSEAEQTGKAIGATLGSAFLLFLWAAGAVITGLLAFFTRGRKTIIVETIQ